jgi:hypothetical protein
MADPTTTNTMPRAARTLHLAPDQKPDLDLTAQIAQLLAAVREHVAGRQRPRRGLCREEAALYIGISPSKFDQLVKDGRMPPPKEVDGRVIWDVVRLDLAFEALPDRGAMKEVGGWAKVE